MGGLIDGVFVALVSCTALGAGLVAGVCLAFSTFVMPALARLPPREGISAMQSINTAALRPAFLGPFLGTALGSVVIGLVAVAGWSSPGSPLLVAGGVLYGVGTVLVTRAGNVPLNQTLAKVSPESVEGAALWTRYVHRWTALNHVRAAAAAVASVSFVLALFSRARSLGFLALLLLLAGCSSLADPRSCSEPPAERLSRAPRSLADTGLFADVARGTLAEGVVPYRPRFELWSDGATKRRWIALPPGATIDTTDMDAWRFPTGTKLWKELTRDGVRVETRFLQKVADAPDAWLAVAYVWNAEGTTALATPEGRRAALGTRHDVPPARECMGCHGGTVSRVLGFSAIQLPSASVAPPSEMSLERLEREHRVTRAAPHAVALPGDATTRAALGYLHANCAHCHNARRPKADGRRCYDPRQSFDLALRVGELDAPSSTAVYRTALGRIVRPGAPGESALLERMTRDGDGVFDSRMPALGTKARDAEGVALLSRWIESLHGP